MQISKIENPVERMRAHVRENVKEITGVPDSSGLELLILVRMVFNLYDTIATSNFGSDEISGPRWSLLMRLMGEEKHGNQSGITPTYLSRCQNVSKNTISALIRGLEEQGLVQRELDPVDHRIFHIGLTPSGRALIESSGKKHVANLNELAEELNPEEREQLSQLLGKLHHSLSRHVPAKMDKLVVE